MANPGKELKEQLDEVEHKIYGDKALLNYYNGNENARGYARLGLLGLGMGLATVPGLGVLTLAMGIGVPILDSLPMFLHKKRFKDRMAMAKINDAVAAQKYKIAKQNQMSKFAKKSYTKDNTLRKNDPTSETVYEDVNLLKDTQQPKINNVENTNKQEEKKVKDSQNNQINYNGTVININGKESEVGDVDVEKRIVSESELNYYNESHEAKLEEENFSKALIEGMKAIDENINKLRKNYGLNVSEEKSETSNNLDIPAIIEQINNVSEEELNDYYNKNYKTNSQNKVNKVKKSKISNFNNIKDYERDR